MESRVRGTAIAALPRIEGVEEPYGSSDVKPPAWNVRSVVAHRQTGDGMFVSMLLTPPTRAPLLGGGLAPAAQWGSTCCPGLIREKQGA